MYISLKGSQRFKAKVFIGGLPTGNITETAFKILICFYSVQKFNAFSNPQLSR